MRSIKRIDANHVIYAMDYLKDLHVYFSGLNPNNPQANATLLAYLVLSEQRVLQRRNWRGKERLVGRISALGITLPSFTPHLTVFPMKMSTAGITCYGPQQRIPLTPDNLKTWQDFIFSQTDFKINDEPCPRKLTLRLPYNYYIGPPSPSP